MKQTARTCSIIRSRDLFFLQVMRGAHLITIICNTITIHRSPRTIPELHLDKSLISGGLRLTEIDSFF